ncbi:hypothetical protein J1614_001154 [Plenodomus biglobosus]|nr:hypothetical protein J1614_001154 [Plenodomus biglobosus]
MQCRAADSHDPAITRTRGVLRFEEGPHAMSGAASGRDAEWRIWRVAIGQWLTGEKLCTCMAVCGWRAGELDGVSDVSFLRPTERGYDWALLNGAGFEERSLL